MSNTIQEQGSKNYPTMRARVEAAVERDAAQPAPVSPDLAKLHARLVSEQQSLPPVLRAPAPVVADVENDGDRGPRASRDPLAAIDAAADAQRARRMSRLLDLAARMHVDEIDLLLLVVERLPGLRARVEAATARGWIDERDDPKSVTQPTLSEHQDADLLRALRSLVPASPLVQRRAREVVIGAERERRGATHG